MLSHSFTRPAAVIAFLTLAPILWPAKASFAKENIAAHNDKMKIAQRLCHGQAEKPTPRNVKEITPSLCKPEDPAAYIYEAACDGGGGKVYFAIGSLVCSCKLSKDNRASCTPP